jgi:hypothetical protein
VVAVLIVRGTGCRGRGLREREREVIELGERRLLTVGFVEVRVENEYNGSW